jgi:hypothetical protein
MLLGNSNIVELEGAMCLPFVFVTGVYCLYHSNLIGCNQLFVVFRVLQDNVMFVLYVISFLSTLRLFNLYITLSLTWRHMPEYPQA